MQFYQYLAQLNACDEAVRWAHGKSFAQAYAECERADWLCWLYARSPGYDLQALTLVKGLQAKQAIHLMKDARSRHAVDVAIRFGRGEASRAELDAAADVAAAVTNAAYAAYATADAEAAYATATAATAAYTAAAYYAADADAATYAAAAAYYAADSDAARAASLRKSAEIFKSIIKLEDFRLNVKN